MSRDAERARATHGAPIWRSRNFLPHPFASPSQTREMFCDLVIVVKILNEIDFAIAVQITQSGDLIAACHVNYFIDNLHTERLEQSRGDPFPRQLREIAIDAAYDPDISIPSANPCALPIFEQIE